MLPSIDQWKALSEMEREKILADSERFNTYTDEALELLRLIGEDLKKSTSVKIIEIGVLNKHGTLILHPHVEESDLSVVKNNGLKRYLGFEVIFSGITSWFEH